MRKLIAFLFVALASCSSPAFADFSSGPGSVQSVGLTTTGAGSFISCTGSPITLSGTFNCTLQFTPSKVVNIMDFGAVMDGTHHPLSEIYGTLAAAQAVCPEATALTQDRDWCAFSGAKNYIINNRDPSTGEFNRTLLVPDGSMYTTTPLNLTCINASQGGGTGCASVYFHGAFVVDFQGRLICATGAACIDALGSRYVHLLGARMWAVSGASEPTIGLQIGRLGNISSAADGWVIDRAYFDGYFKTTPIYNFAGEGLHGYSSTFHNQDNNGAAYAAIFDGGNHWQVPSLFVTQTVPQDSNMSFDDMTWDGTAFYPQLGNSNGIWIYGGNGMHFDKVYVTTAAGSCFTLWSDSTGSDQSFANQLYANVHCETISGGGPASHVKFASKNAASQYRAYNLNIHEFASAVTGTYFVADANTNAVNLLDLQFHNTEGGVGINLFDQPGIYTVTGDITLSHSATFVYPGIFTGRLCYVAGGAGNCTYYNSGPLVLGNQRSSSSPVEQFYSSGNTTPDATITGSGGSGTVGSGTLTYSGNHVFQPSTDGFMARFKNAAGTKNGLSIDTLNHAVYAASTNVNGVKFQGTASGSSPVISPDCGDASCGLWLVAIGAKGINAAPGSDNTQAFQMWNAARSATLFVGDTTNMQIIIGGNLYTSGTTPTMGACGTSPSISGTDVGGKITIGSGSPTTCTVNFHATLANIPHDVVLTPATATAAGQSANVYVSSLTATVWQITGTALVGSYYYHVE